MKELIKPQKIENEYIYAEAYCETYDWTSRHCSGVYCSDYTLGREACTGFYSETNDNDLLF